MKCMQRKSQRLYDMAMKMGAPVIGLIDCAGLRLQEATDALNAFGEIYLKQTTGIRCDSADYSYLRYMRRRTGTCTGSD